MTLAIVGNTGKLETPVAIQALVAILTRRSLPFVLHESLLEAFPSLAGLGEFVTTETLRTTSEVVIAFGGDGTMLSASRALAGSGLPLLGVNLGKLGFLAEFSLSSLEETIDDLVRGECRIVQRTLLEATFPDNPELDSLLGLNDIVIDKRDGSLMLRLKTYVNGDYLGTYNADGLILATPTGSTAYSLAVGGPVVVPSARVMVIAPIAPHMLTARPVVVPDDALVEIYPTAHREGETVQVYADGQVYRRVPMGTRVRITCFEQRACLVKRTSTTYFDILRAKLLWGREPILESYNIPSSEES